MRLSVTPLLRAGFCTKSPRVPGLFVIRFSNIFYAAALRLGTIIYISCGGAAGWTTTHRWCLRSRGEPRPGFGAVLAGILPMIALVPKRPICFALRNAASAACELERPRELFNAEGGEIAGWA